MLLPGPSTTWSLRCYNCRQVQVQQDVLTGVLCTQAGLISVQIDALLSETCLQPEEVAAAQEAVEQLRQVLTRIKPHQVRHWLQRPIFAQWCLAIPGAYKACFILHARSCSHARHGLQKTYTCMLMYAIPPGSPSCAFKPSQFCPTQ